MPESFFYPRPEYPRPERQRGTVAGYDWLNLNGPWQFRFDGERRGIEEQWFLPDVREWREQIIVPFCWESLAAWGEGDAAGNDNYYSIRVFRRPLEVTRANHRSAPRYEVGWYRRALELPDTEAWARQRVILHIGASDFFTDCWSNGIHLGHHEGGYTPFEFDLTDVLNNSGASRQALLVLRVEDPMDNAQQPVGKQWHWYTTTSGIWQTVYVEPRDPVHIRSLRISSDIGAGTVRFKIDCTNANDACNVEVVISPSDSGVQTALLDVRNSFAERTIKLSSVRLWDPNSPELYVVVLRLRCKDKLFDTVRTYFGMRKID